jgi:predicted RNase H-like HicB family nuclease
MHMPIAIEPVAGNGYRARGGEPLAFTAEGATPEEAVRKLRELIQAHLASGVQIVPLELPTMPHPLARFAGMYDPNDPLVQEWLQIMAENRRRADEDPDVL